MMSPMALSQMLQPSGIQELRLHKGSFFSVLHVLLILILMILYELACKCLTSHAGVGPLYTSSLQYIISSLGTTTYKHSGRGGLAHIGVPVPPRIVQQTYNSGGKLTRFHNSVHVNSSSCINNLCMCLHSALCDRHIVYKHILLFLST